jgi:hypothetical protein
MLREVEVRAIEKLFAVTAVTVNESDAVCDPVAAVPVIVSA